MAVAMVSVRTGIPVRGNVVITGELGLGPGAAAIRSVDGLKQRFETCSFYAAPHQPLIFVVPSKHVQW
jgi:predicted ATP-dependent serine protease